MSIRGVANAVRRVRTQLEEYPASAYWYNETTTRYVLINPMIESLGWDMYDLDQCGYEIDPKGEMWGKSRLTMCSGHRAGGRSLSLRRKPTSQLNLRR